MPTAPLKSLATVAWAQLLVFLDFRIDGLDVIPDPLGWVIAAVALGSLGDLHPGYRIAAGACVVAVIPSAVDWIDPAGTPVAVIITVASTVFIFATCTALMATAPMLSGSANVVRWADLWLTCASVPLIVAAEGDDSLDALVVVAIVATLGVFIWFLVLLFQGARPAPSVV